MFRLFPKILFSICFTVVICGFGLTTETAHAQTFTNGGFEADSWGAGWNPGVSPTGWDTVLSGDGDWPYGVRNTANTTNAYTPFGDQFIALCAARDCPDTSRGSVSQTVSGFVPGKQYRLNFQHAPENHADTVGEVSIVNVSISGGTPASTDFSGQGNYFAQWIPRSLVFTANATELTFTFTGAGADTFLNTESGIDEVSVTPLNTTSNVTAVPTMSEYGLILMVVGLLVVVILRLRASAKGS